MTTPTTAATTLELPRVAVIGAGTMGRQIATQIATSGRTVALFDADADARDQAIPRIRDELVRLPAAPQYRHHPFRLPLPADPEAAIARIRPAATLDDAVTDVDLVIEAVREEIEVKRAVFRELDRLAPGAILTTNSSSLPSSLLVPAVSDPTRLLNTHFFAPIWIRAMLELMSCGQTAPEVMATMARFGRSLGLVTATVQGESKGFIINRVWRAVKRESLRVVDEGHATPDDVDRLWMLFFGTSVGPFGIMDMVGLDVAADIEASYAVVATDPADHASAILHRLVDAGDLGEKVGKGFYEHPDPAYLQTSWLFDDDERR